jgi:hypothetical protein
MVVWRGGLILKRFFRYPSPGGESFPVTGETSQNCGFFGEGADRSFIAPT